MKRMRNLCSLLLVLALLGACKSSKEPPTVEAEKPSEPTDVMRGESADDQQQVLSLKATELDSPVAIELPSSLPLQTGKYLTAKTTSSATTYGLRFILLTSRFRSMIRC